MKNKLGYTLIEIIVCLVLIVGIGSITTITILKNKNKENEEINKITQKILDAANVYINVEKDGNGETFEYGILNGGKGVYISLQNLVDKGYIKSSIIDDLVLKTNKEPKDLKLLAVNALGTDGVGECGSDISYKVSWEVENGSEIYICPYSTEKDSNVVALLNKLLMDNEIKLGIPDINNYQDSDKGLYILPDNSTNSIYFYGKVQNNYLKFNNMLWRIVRTNNDGSLKIILEDIIDYEFSKVKIEEQWVKYNGYAFLSSLLEEKINIKGDEYPYIQCYYPILTRHSTLCFYNHALDSSKYYDVVVSKDSIPISVNFNNMYDTMYYNNTYFKLIKTWMVDNIEESKYIVKNFNYCQNSYDYSYKKKDFTCEENRYYTSANGEGMLGYKEFKLSGNNNSYLTDLNKSFYLADYESDYASYYYNAESKQLTTINTSGKYRNDDWDLNLYPSVVNKGNGEESIFIFSYRSTDSFKIYGLRPVINLKNNICLSGNGTIDNPYIVADC